MQRRKRERVQKAEKKRKAVQRLTFWRDAAIIQRLHEVVLVELVGSSQFSSLGTVVLGVLARVADATGLTRAMREGDEADFRPEERRGVKRTSLDDDTELLTLRGGSLSLKAGTREYPDAENPADDLGLPIERASPKVSQFSKPPK